MANPLAAGENDPPGGGGGGRENDGPGGRFAGSDGVMPFNLGPLPGWDDIFDPPKLATRYAIQLRRDRPTRVSVLRFTAPVTSTNGTSLSLTG